MMPRVIKVDIDIDYGYFMNKLYGLYVEAVEAVAREVFGLDIEDVVCNPSPSGKTHCWIHLSDNVSEELALMLSFFFYDDHHRFSWNLSRLESLGRTFSVLFEKKERKKVTRSNQGDR